MGKSEWCTLFLGGRWTCRAERTTRWTCEWHTGLDTHTYRMALCRLVAFPVLLWSVQESCVCVCVCARKLYLSACAGNHITWQRAKEHSIALATKRVLLLLSRRRRSLRTHWECGRNKCRLTDRWGGILLHRRDEIPACMIIFPYQSRPWRSQRHRWCSEWRSKAGIWTKHGCTSRPV